MRDRGCYFVTICVAGRERLFGEVLGGGMELTAWGRAAEACWREIPAHFAGIKLDLMVVMPDHVHGILGLEGANLSTVIGSYKSAVTRRVNELRGTPGRGIWQRGYYAHMICSVAERIAVTRYIEENPKRWAQKHSFRW